MEWGSLTKMMATEYVTVTQCMACVCAQYNDDQNYRPVIFLSELIFDSML